MHLFEGPDFGRYQSGEKGKKKTNKPCTWWDLNPRSLEVLFPRCVLNRYPTTVANFGCLSFYNINQIVTL